jgi:hypothetical protein
MILFYKKKYRNMFSSSFLHRAKDTQQYSFLEEHAKKLAMNG